MGLRCIVVAFREVHDMISGTLSLRSVRSDTEIIAMLGLADAQSTASLAFARSIVVIKTTTTPIKVFQAL